MRGNKQAIELLNANPVLSAQQEVELVELRESCFAPTTSARASTAFAEKRQPRWTGR